MVELEPVSEAYLEPSQPYETKYSRMDQIKYVEDSLKRFEVIWYVIYIKFSGDCILHILVGPILNTMSDVGFCQNSERLIFYVL